MKPPGRWRPLWWLGAVGVGLYRCAVLLAATAVIPAIVVMTGYWGTRWTLSWQWAGPSAALPWRVLAGVGEVALALWWAFLVAGALAVLASRPLVQAVRRRAKAWLGVEVEGCYLPVPSPTRMATGYWWNGYEYHRSERDARRQAWLATRRRDPQARRDLLWTLVAAVTVLPATAAPLAVTGGGLYLLVGSGPRWLGVALVAAGMMLSVWAWRVLAVVVPGLLGPGGRSGRDRRVDELEAINASLSATQAAELERIERGLHDGAQARLVALGMSLGAAERLVDTDPEAAKAVLADARASSAAALGELRLLVRGINPPVLVERGLVDAVRALALDAPQEVVVHASLPSRPERPIEAALYYAVAELLANAVKHAHATYTFVDLGYQDSTVTAMVLDDGVGGATEAAGSGLAGIRRRAAAFGGHLEIESPVGGPTRIIVAVPCKLS
jgi:signal transduction histidine kinase